MQTTSTFEFSVSNGVGQYAVAGHVGLKLYAITLLFHQVIL